LFWLLCYRNFFFYFSLVSVGCHAHLTVAMAPHPLSTLTNRSRCSLSLHGTLPVLRLRCQQPCGHQADQGHHHHGRPKGRDAVSPSLAQPPQAAVSHRGCAARLPPHRGMRQGQLFFRSPVLLSSVNCGATLNIPLANGTFATTTATHHHRERAHPLHGVSHANEVYTTPPSPPSS
jgi:hypothetical protein